MPFLKFKQEESCFHFLFLILFELKSFQIKSFEKVFVCNLAPILYSMNFFDISQLIYLDFNSFLENFTSLQISCLEEPLKFFFLISVTIFVDHLKDSKSNNFLDYFLSFFVIFFTFFISDRLKEAQSLD